MRKILLIFASVFAFVLPATAFAFGGLGSWTTTTSLPVALYSNSSANTNSYAYVVGGETGNNTGILATVYYAPFNSTNGTLGSWSATTPLPQAISGGQAVEINGYLYSIAGANSALTAIANVYYAYINANGTVGTWTSTTALPASLVSTRISEANGYIYLVGGDSSVYGGSPVSTVYYAQPNASNGAIGTWNSATALPQATDNAQSFVANGYLYLVGGQNTSSVLPNAYYAKINSNGTLGSWTTTTSLPQGVSKGSDFFSNGTIYIIGGENSYDGAASSNVYYGLVNVDGSIGSWSAATPFVEPIALQSTIAANGYAYEISGKTTGNTATATTYDTQLTPLCTVSLSPSSIGYGSSSTLNWSVGNATQIYINNVGWISASSTSSGSFSVTPSATTDYSCYAWSASSGSGAWYSASLAVTPPSTPTVSIVASSTSIVAGASTHITADFTAGSSQTLSQTPTVVYLTSGSSWTVPSNWNSSDNTIEAIGAGGGGGSRSAGGGGGGGEYRKITNLALTTGALIPITIGSGGAAGSAGGSTTFDTNLLIANGGSGGTSSGGTGGSGGTGTVGFFGGSGGAVYNGEGGNGYVEGGGGGGAGGPYGVGANGTQFSPGNGGAGDAGHGGAGGPHDAAPSSNGSAGTEWNSSHGSGGGGGGIGSGATGGTGGNYGGGGGGGTAYGFGAGTGGAGAPGLIVITYYPYVVSGSDTLTSDNIDEPAGTGIGATTNPDASKTITFTATSTGTYTFWAMAQTGYYPSWTPYASTTITVTPGPSCTVTLSPASIAKGSSSTLSWTSTNATSFSINNVGSLTPDTPGSTSVSPSASTDYTGTASVSGVSNTCTASGTVPAGTLNVSCTPAYTCSGSAIQYTNAQCALSTVTTCGSPAYCSSGSGSCLYPTPAPVAGGGLTGNLTATPSLVRPGETTEVTWDMSNVQSCSVTGTNGDSWSGLSGSFASGVIEQQTLYTLSCVQDDPSQPAFSETVTVGAVPGYREE